MTPAAPLRAATPATALTEQETYSENGARR